jgi:hypothetical protein
MSKGLSYLMFYYHFNYHPKDLSLVHAHSYDIDDYRKLLALWKKMIENKDQYSFTTENFSKSVLDLLTEETMEVDDFYYYIVNRGNLVPNNNKRKANNEYERAFYLTLLHLVILQVAHKTYEGTFSERLVDKTSK